MAITRLMRKRNADLGDKNDSKGDKEESDDEENIGDETVIQVDFEGRNPIDSDFDGIKQLLNQLFLKAHINLNDLTEHIIKQNYVGSVIKQSEADDEADEEDSDPNEVFGITTIINLSGEQKSDCIHQLRALLLKLCNSYGSEEVHSFVQDLLSNPMKPVGLFINERFVNIPPQITVPLFKSLKSEIKRAKEKRMAYDFSYIILISKLYKMELNNDKNKSKKSKKSDTSEIIWSNPEEEVIDQEAEVKFEFSVRNEADSGLVGEWNENDDEMTPMRRILVIPFSKFDSIIEKVEEAVSA
ncbi:UNVERIFIED_CONTAM: hypothetical protein PYX00_004180 [Menopon gallinae]|uniref:Protein BCCIP homolog n=2 Tax=Menopon gallinae TaxID=328185 RepID=A0AAW2I5A4_9NEOP